MPLLTKRNTPFYLLLLGSVILFLFRVFYGLNNRFWDEDEKHIYLLGLELFSFKSWPYFGPDVVHTATQIPGALQSLLVGSAFFLWKIPEAPFFLVNFLSFLGFLFFAYYLNKHFPKYSVFSLLLWLTTLPWSLEYTTHMYNPSYMLLPMVLFFVAFFESFPQWNRGVFSQNICFFLMGLSLAAIMQLHLSWPLLLPFLCVSMWQVPKSFSKWVKVSFFFSLGLLLPLFLVFPTIYTFGLEKVFHMNSTNSELNFHNMLYIFNNFFRLISYGTYETFLFIGETTEKRIEFLKFLPPLIFLFVFLWLLMVFQVLSMIYVFLRIFREKNDKRALFTIKLFVFSTCVASLIFILSNRPPVSRNLYILYPVSLWSMLVAMNFIMKRYRWGKKIFYAGILASVIFHMGLVYNRFVNYPSHSLYSNRDLLVKSLEEKNPYLFETPRYEWTRLR